MSTLINIILEAADQEGTESIVERWFKQPGDLVKQYEPVLEISTDKVSFEVSAPASGVLKTILKDANESINPGEVLGQIELVSEAKAEARGEKKVSEGSRRRRGREKNKDSVSTKGLSPAVRRLLDQHGLDMAEIKGSGRDGRITAEDVEAHLALRQTPKVFAQQTGITGKMVPHSVTRLHTARRMVESILKTAPHVTVLFDADMSAVISHRQAHKSAFEKKGVKLTLTSYFVDAAVKALQTLPQANSRWHDHALEIFEDFNIGIAVATEKGLVVPVIHKTQNLDLLGVAEKLQEITDLAHSGNLQKSDIQSGTFTITNHGMTGSLIATPIINQPQSAILGIGKLEKRVVVIEKDGHDVMEIKPMIYVTLTFDHRAIDGFEANMFLAKFVKVLQNIKL